MGFFILVKFESFFRIYDSRRKFYWKQVKQGPLFLRYVKVSLFGDWNCINISPNLWKRWSFIILKCRRQYKYYEYTRTSPQN